jgi:hypothetical protein
MNPVWQLFKDRVVDRLECIQSGQESPMAMIRAR